MLLQPQSCSIQDHHRDWDPSFHAFRNRAEALELIEHPVDPVHLAGVVSEQDGDFDAIDAQPAFFIAADLALGLSADAARFLTEFAKREHHAGQKAVSDARQEQLFGKWTVPASNRGSFINSQLNKRRPEVNEKTKIVDVPDADDGL